MVPCDYKFPGRSSFLAQVSLWLGPGNPTFWPGFSALIPWSLRSHSSESLLSRGNLSALDLFC